MYVSSCNDVLRAGNHVAIGNGIYIHHCVYCGGGRAIHLTLDGINEVYIDELVGKKTFWIIEHGNAYPTDIIVQRARSRLYDKTKYNLIFNNCEHFCEWCCTGFKFSHQVFATMVIGWFLSPPLGHVLGQLSNHGGNQKYKLKGRGTYKK